MPGVAAEAFCACVLRSWGLNVPEPAIVDEDPIAFASTDVGYPNLLQHIGWTANLPAPVRVALEAEGARLVASLSDTPTAVAADEAIDNRDRNLGNILWDGQKAAWIDHERAVSVVPMEDANKLVQMVCIAGDSSAIQRAAIAIALTLTSQAQFVTEAEERCGGIPGTSTMAKLVAGRITTLANRVINRFPRPADLLSVAGP